MWAILGANGVGKSTFLHTLAGLKKTKNVFISGQSISEMPLRKKAQQITLLPQSEEMVFAMTVSRYCQEARFPFRQIPMLDEDMVALESIFDALEIGTLRHRCLNRLSGGERQRVYLAAAIYQNTPFLLLDEPTSQLDLQHQLKVMHYFSELKKKSHRSIILATHDVSLAERFCDHAILFFADGHYVSGPIHETFNETNLEKLYNCHAREVTCQGHRFWQFSINHCKE